MTCVALPFPRSIHPVRLEKNLFHCELIQAARLLDRLQKFLVMRSEIFVKDATDSDGGLIDTRTEVALAVLSCMHGNRDEGH